MAVNDFSNQNIQDTYQRVVQTDGTNVADGTGSLLPISFEGNDVIVPGALKAQSYIVSESIVNVSSGSTVFGDSADDSHSFNGAITASGNISSSGTVIANSLVGTLTGTSTGLAGTPSIAVANITASGNISASSLNVEHNSIFGNFIDVKTSLRHVDDTDTQIKFTADDTIDLNTGGIVRVRVDNDGVNINTGRLNVNGNITSSDNISASGTITADKIRAGGYAGSDIFDIAAGAGGIDTDGAMSCTGFSNNSTSTFGGRLDIVGGSSYVQTESYVSASQLISSGHITASGNISASGHITASDMFLSGDLTLGKTDDSVLTIVSDGSNISHEIHGRENQHSFLSTPTTQNLGIGLNTDEIPQAKLHVSGNISASGDLNITNITASSDISASGTIKSDRFQYGDNNTYIDFNEAGENTIRLAPNMLKMFGVEEAMKMLFP